MTENNLVTKQSKFGTLGVDVGFINRWSRLFWGLLILVPTATNILLNFSPSSESIRFYGSMLLYFAAIALAYTSVYWFLGERGILQWRIKYGGCEVVSIPIIIFRKRYPTFCIPLVALDALEKAVVEGTGGNS